MIKNNSLKCVRGIDADQRGFVLTVELILIVTILVIGTFIGVVAIRDALIKYQFNQQDQSVVVLDANNKNLGPVVGFDEHDAPQLFFMDSSQSQVFRVLIGVRDDRFSTREPIYYTGLNCSGDPCIKATSSELLDSKGLSGLKNTGAVSYFQALQGAPNYAIGRSDDGIVGQLFREPTDNIEACPIDLLNTALGSRYISQKVIFGEPCESPFTLPLNGGVPPAVCGATALPATGASLCGDVCGGNQAGQCDCPVNFHRSGPFVPVTNEQVLCCPNGYDIDENIDGLTLAQDLLNGTAPVCEGAGLVKAVPVAGLENYEPPFSVNLPSAGAGSSQWYYVPPNGEESGTANGQDWQYIEPDGEN